ncbi:hypothetical protein B7Z17_04680 [Candidatus Saccharibacteria bacterium 32-49-10]|nr:MAG: hypothetical protein B7Z17_04680 [Candidatus Saccharibacteria bacterium 32-49-10]
MLVKADKTQAIEATMRELVHQRHYQGAIDTAERWIVENSTPEVVAWLPPLPLYHYAVALTRIGRYEQALALFFGRVFGVFQPDAVLYGDWLREVIGRGLASQGQYAAAENVLREAYALHASVHSDHAITDMVSIARNQGRMHAFDLAYVSMSEVYADANKRDNADEGFKPIRRHAAWWMLLIHCASDHDFEEAKVLAAQVASTDASSDRQEFANWICFNASPSQAKRKARQKFDKS